MLVSGFKGLQYNQVMQMPSIRVCRTMVLAVLIALAVVVPLRAQDRSGSEAEKIKPVTLRIGVPNKQSEREVTFPLVVETSGTASVGRLRAELELSTAEGWVFRSIELTRGLDLRSNVRKRKEGTTKTIVEWDLTAEGKELPTGHVALFRVLADKARAKGAAPASDNPPSLTVRKMSWGLAEFEKPPENLPQLSTPDNVTGNPDVSCFFFTH